MTAYKHILVPVDESSTSNHAVAQAINIAKQGDTKVTLLSVIAVDPFVSVDFYKVAPALTDYFLKAEQNAQNHLKEIAQRLTDEGIATETKIVHGVAAAEGILAVADEISADLIVMGSHGRTGFKKLVLGSVAQHVVTHSPLPVLIAKF